MSFHNEECFHRGRNDNRTHAHADNCKCKASETGVNSRRGGGFFKGGLPSMLRRRQSPVDASHSERNSKAAKSVQNVAFSKRRSPGASFNEVDSTTRVMAKALQGQTPKSSRNYSQTVLKNPPDSRAHYTRPASVISLQGPRMGAGSMSQLPVGCDCCRNGSDPRKGQRNNNNNFPRGNGTSDSQMSMREAYDLMCQCQNRTSQTAFPFGGSSPPGQAKSSRSQNPFPDWSRMDAIAEETEDSTPKAEAKAVKRSSALDDTEKIKDSCADFLSIVHDTVMETVTKSVENMMREHLGQTRDKIESLAAQMMRNECLLSKMYLDLVDKMTQQNEKNMRQFKLLCQIITESQRAPPPPPPEPNRYADTDRGGPLVNDNTFAIISDQKETQRNRGVSVDYFDANSGVPQGSRSGGGSQHRIRSREAERQRRDQEQYQKLLETFQCAAVSFMADKYGDPKGSPKSPGSGYKRRSGSDSPDRSTRRPGGGKSNLKAATDADAFCELDNLGSQDWGMFVGSDSAKQQQQY